MTSSCAFYLIRQVIFLSAVDQTIYHSFQIDFERAMNGKHCNVHMVHRTLKVSFLLHITADDGKHLCTQQ